MSYIDLLKRPEWHDKCEKILRRDQFTCKFCGIIGSHNGYAFYETDNISNIYKALSIYDYSGCSFQEIIESNYFSFDYFKDRKYIIPDYYQWEFLYSVKYKQYPKLYIIAEHYPLHLVLEKQMDSFYIYTFEIDVNDFKYRNFYGTVFPDRNGSQIISSKELPEIVYINLFTFTQLSNSKYNNTPSGMPIFIFQFSEKLSEKFLVSILPGSLSEGPAINIIKNNIFISHQICEQDIPIKNLNIHHKFYFRNKKPWEYNDDALITLCEDCHHKWHQQNHVPIFESGENSGKISYAQTCPKCNGSGFLPQYKYHDNGICYMCMGEGVIGL